MTAVWIGAAFLVGIFIGLMTNQITLIRLRLHLAHVTENLIQREIALIKLRSERESVASGKVTCADCNSILARW